MENNLVAFSGSIPEIYEEFLGEFMFEPFAEDLVSRIGVRGVENVLELACGTGRLTRRLLGCLPASVKLIATDINSGMLAVARNKTLSDNVRWDVVDMTEMSYKDQWFDVIVCQFGLMLVEQKQKALSEMSRVLKANGKLLFNVWGKLEENKIWEIGIKVMGSFLKENPIPPAISPFSMKDEGQTRRLMEQAGFRGVKISAVTKTGTIASARQAAKGFIEGLPIREIIMRRDPQLITKIEDTLEKELIEQLGDHPMHSTLSAWVVEATK
jgi:ubiquinone/menaquinone biosynthesis C-methylase UbiE